MDTKEIKTVALIGLGALGIMYGHHLSKVMPFERLRIIADRARIKRYETERVYCNGEQCRFNYVSPEEDPGEPADLVIFAVKYPGLAEAIEAVRKQVGDNTVILSVLNGITSEEVIGRTYGMEKMIYCVAQGMDAVKEGNRMTYVNMGILCIGDLEPGIVSSRVQRVADFFERVKIPYEVDTNMRKRLWGKLMLNVGVNQTVAVYEGTYGTIQREGEVRETMIAAMREVMALAPHEGVILTEDDLCYWLDLLGTLNPAGKPSMRQDLEAGRPSEVELFAGTIIKLGQQYGIPTPVNQTLYDRIIEMESHF
ncbi:MAG: ketopantoate reductase family protein [Syntrophomonadaceae bacterium]|nr:ketopantoate reductase family protein [Syntrophomonadaceae bacterium]